MMKMGVILAGAGLVVMASAAHSDTLLMSYEDYMGRCLGTYGEDKVTKTVCEAQYQAMTKKEQELMAQADVSETDRSRLPADQSKSADKID
ncbi:hypothetical protein [uncultured Photobacterium sp.]|uniref:hypothetical protein n=1 Tax=uncultured Photobacterium sp. TaxID=173973 RepID=UPI00262F7E33|nr:hypothetical protein [uncultured Photobacterium sp.]